MGVQAFKAKQFQNAFELYTEAIRLRPSKAAYHCNRAAAALKLHQFAVAVEDARYDWQLQKGQAAKKTHILLPANLRRFELTVAHHHLARFQSQRQPNALLYCRN